MIEQSPVKGAIVEKRDASHSVLSFQSSLLLAITLVSESVLIQLLKL